MMPRGKAAATLLLLTSLLLIAGVPAQAGDPPLGGARISAVEGEALVQFGDGDGGGWRAAPLHMPLLPGDRLQAGASGRLEVFLSNGTAIRLGPASSARLVAVPPSEPDRDAAAEMDLEAGRAIVATGEGEPSRPALFLNATGTRVQVYPHSHLRVEAIASDASEVTLHDGAATVDTLGTSIPLRVAETLQVSRGGAVLAATRPPDALDQWSEARDRALAAAPLAASPLPAPLAPYAADLNHYGQWTAVPEYGEVWRPTAVAAGWAPFSAGQWVWRGGTWVWLPLEPWGWAPFHYGRWRWDTMLGWYWVPPRPRLVVWCPGAVAFIRTPTLVTWIPLAPGEIYYAPRPYGIWSAPVAATTVINITHVTIHKTFINAAAPAAVAAAPATTFATATVVSPTITRVRLATVAGAQPVSVVTPAALAPAAAAVRPAPVTAATTTPAPPAQARIATATHAATSSATAPQAPLPWPAGRVATTPPVRNATVAAPLAAPAPGTPAARATSATATSQPTTGLSATAKGTPASPATPSSPRDMGSARPGPPNGAPNRSEWFARRLEARPTPPSTTAQRNPAPPAGPVAQPAAASTAAPIPPVPVSPPALDRSQRWDQVRDHQPRADHGAPTFDLRDARRVHQGPAAVAAVQPASPVPDRHAHVYATPPAAKTPPSSIPQVQPPKGQLHAGQATAGAAPPKSEKRHSAPPQQPSPPR